MMRTTVIICILALLMSSVAMAQAPKIGLGVYGGLNYPVGQDDQAGGTIFGVRAKIKALPIITLEPQISFTSFGEPEMDEITLGLDGSKVNAYGIDATIGAPFGGKGFAMFGVVGAGFYKYKRDQTSQDDTNLGWSAGLGFSIGLMPMASVDARGQAYVVPYDEGGSKKSVSVTVGLNYFFGM
jgi:hypothetical protein